MNFDQLRSYAPHALLPTGWEQVRTVATTNVSLLDGRLSVRAVKCRVSEADGGGSAYVLLYDIEAPLKLSGLSDAELRSARISLAKASVAPFAGGVCLLYLPAVGAIYARQEALETKTRSVNVYATAHALSVVLLQFVSRYSLLGEAVRRYYLPASTSALVTLEEEEDEPEDAHEAPLPVKLEAKSKRGRNGDEVVARFPFGRDVCYRAHNSSRFAISSYSVTVDAFERTHVDVKSRRFCFGTGLTEAMNEAVRKSFEALGGDSAEIQQLRRDSTNRRSKFFEWSEDLFARFHASTYLFREDASAIEEIVPTKYPEVNATYKLEVFLLVVYYYLSLPFVELFSDERSIRGLLEIVAVGPPLLLIERKARRKRAAVNDEDEEEEEEEEEEGEEEEDEDSGSSSASLVVNMSSRRSSSVFSSPVTVKRRR